MTQLLTAFTSGHLVPISCHETFTVGWSQTLCLSSGGATGLIGDPSFKDTERSLQTKDTVEGWVQSIQAQVSRFLDFENGDNKAEMVNNYDWFSDISFIDFLRDVGKYFTVNYMMSKESVKNGLKQAFRILSLLTRLCKAMTF